MNHHAMHSLASGRRRSISDPLDAALRPPPNETPEQRERRLQAEEEARRRSDNIDKMLREGDRQNKKRKIVKVLLLGQSESGKSTTLKQFQLLHAPSAFHADRMAWRYIIYLNLLRSVRRILEAISPEVDNAAEEYDPAADGPLASIIISASGSSSSSNYAETGVPKYELYKKRLAPLHALECKLMQQLADPDDSDGMREPTHLPTHQLSWNEHQDPHSGYTSHTFSGGRPSPRIDIPSGSRSSPSSPVSGLNGRDELALPASFNWRRPFALGRIQSPVSPQSGELHGWWEDPEDPVHVLNRCAPTISEMWRDPNVKRTLAEKRLRLEESSGFYLHEIDRITAKMYFPTDDDVLKARLKTTGVVEHTFTMNKDSDFRGVEWKIYDVGGSRQQRHAWAPYFDDVHAIIFLAPISAFDQVLVEDTKVNRMEDSLLLWKSVVQNPLLQNVNIILFLNKCDLLKSKLDSGVQLAHHLHAYRNRPNDYENISKYFYNKFGAVHQSYTSNKSRELFIHFTSVTNTRQTRVIIYNVRDMILTKNLRSSSLM